MNCSIVKDCSDVGGCVHGVCMLGGNCSCDPGWTGMYLWTAAVPWLFRRCILGIHDTLSPIVILSDDPISPTTGDNCSLAVCPKNCNGNGVCDQGVCVCDVGWGGRACGSKLCVGQSCPFETNLITGGCKGTSTSSVAHAT